MNVSGYIMFGIVENVVEGIDLYDFLQVIMLVKYFSDLCDFGFFYKEWVEIQVICVDGFCFFVVVFLMQVEIDVEKEFFVVYVCDIICRVNLQKVLCEVYDEVKISEKVKFDFLVVMSYEIRILLNGIFGVFVFL